MRIDKFLKVSMWIKRRTVAQEACDGGRVKVNGKTVKPSFTVKEGDVVEIAFNTGAVKFRITAIKETVKKQFVNELYEIITE